MQTTAENLNKLRTTLERHYHPVYWYLPEYLEFLHENPDKDSSAPLLNKLRRFIAIKRLPLPLVVVNKEIISRISIQLKTDDEALLTYQCIDLTETQLSPSNALKQSYTRSVKVQYLMQHLDLFEIFCNRNRVTDPVTALLCKQVSETLIDNKQHRSLYMVERFNRVLLELLARDVKIILGKYHLTCWKSTPVEGEGRVLLQNLFFSPHRSKRDSNKQQAVLDNITNQDLIAFFK